MPSYYRERGKWVCAYSVRDGDGRVHRKKRRGFALERDAKRWYDGIAGSLLDGSHADAERLTVAQWLRRWHAVYCASLAPSTRRAYQISIERHLIPRLGAKLRLAQLRPDMAQALCNGLCAATRALKSGGPPRRYSAGHIRQIMSCLSAALGQAVHDGLISRNPCQRVRLPELPAPDRAYCTPEQLRAILARLRGGPYYMPALLCAMLGLRRGEALGLKWEAVDLAQKTVRIRSQIVCEKGGVAERPLKTKSSVRQLLIPDALVEALRRHRLAQAENRLQYGGRYRDEGFVCCTKTGGAQHPDAVSRGVGRAMEAIAPGRTLHDLRHSYATLLRQQGIAIEVISSLLGHHDVGTTYAFYVGEDDAAKKTAAGAIQSLLPL